ncbi:hypothetical protein GFC01_11945 [Desulfofundulus thermobenzoicus]|uniref:Sigma-54 factor interaction domain-containing protein n=1 Tax=Desulfofundulus thermobenzoicus TaxID=29376 RepID=A0A6N7ITW5_9FIRM|nr:sigma 54-interacting transcriptional regulator [Desulfofundulus thermobenzoicus]MQL52959.1 hypothetical protein [Desulfofundulus thermobenzoicus]
MGQGFGHGKTHFVQGKIRTENLPADIIGSSLWKSNPPHWAKKGGNPGKFELADQGTIFLDEIGEMPVDLQAALLRVLEERRVMRVGGREYIPVNVRVIAATNKDLALEVEKGNFRRDLFYRLSVMVIQLPPLRERKADIRELATYFLKRISGRLGKNVEGFAPEALDLFLNYHWPGNIRELQNMVERAVNLATGPVITTDLLPPGLIESVTSRMISPAKKEAALIRSAEEQAIRNCLARFRSKTEAARYLGISRSTLYRKMKEYAISEVDFNPLSSGRGQTF